MILKAKKSSNYEHNEVHKDNTIALILSLARTEVLLKEKKSVMILYQ